MFKDLGIKGRVLLLTLLPTSLLAMVLGGYFTWVQLSDMRAQLIERGQLIAEQLAPLAATALARKDTAVLNRIANEALDQPDVRAVTFLDARQERLAHAGPSMLTVAPAGDASHLSMSTELDTTHFLLPVLGRHHSLSGATEPDDERVLGWVELELSHHGTLLRGYRSLFTSLLLIAAGLGVTALLALRMSRAINAPLELISQGVAQLKEGRMETRLPPMGSNELDELASGINRMAETLQSAQEEMQHNIDQATEDVRQNLETIEIQNIELDLARKEALEASRIKSEFLANMSHEIRTPLNGILGFTNLLQKSELSPRQQDYLTTIQKSAERVSEFADLDSLQESLRNPPPGQLPISLAVLGVSAAIHPPEELSQSFWEFERLGCKTLVLCPTTEQAQYHATLPDEQVEAKPACTRKLQRKLQELLQVRPTRSDKPHAMVSGRPPRLLCVDDNPANLLLVQTLLSDLGAQVTAVDSGYAALEVVQRERFDLVFMDVQMPGMDGRQATEAIRRWEAEREVSPVPVIALTAHALSNEKRALLQAGMDDYLTKPIDEQQLAQVVLKWTGLSLGQSLASMSRAPQLGQLSVLDPEEGLRLAAGKADLAADMLAMLLASLAADRQAIRQARDNDDRTALLERVHRLHGATRYCGVPQLRAACQTSETLLKQNDPAAAAALDELDKAIEALADTASATTHLSSTSLDSSEL
ncbi:TPA: response regulator [Pseudomonas aeruginosa]|nr:response regulator [Pseudomonas aeruginosa]